MEREIKLSAGSNLESAVYTLLAAKARNEDVYCNFNGVVLHSNTVSMDSAYMEVLGCTKREYDERQKEKLEKYEREEKLAQQKAYENIPGWIEKGQSLIFPERYAEWEKYVKAHATDLYYGFELDAALEIMTALENGATVEEAKQILDKQGRLSSSLIRNIIFLFSSKGPEFWEATAHEEISAENKQILEAKKQENIQLAQNNAEKTTNHTL